MEAVLLRPTPVKPHLSFPPSFFVLILTGSCDFRGLDGGPQPPQTGRPYLLKVPFQACPMQRVEVEPLLFVNSSPLGGLLLLTLEGIAGSLVLVPLSPTFFLLETWPSSTWPIPSFWSVKTGARGFSFFHGH